MSMEWGPACPVMMYRRDSQRVRGPDALPFHRTRCNSSVSLDRFYRIQ